MLMVHSVVVVFTPHIHTAHKLLARIVTPTIICSAHTAHYIRCVMQGKPKFGTRCLSMEPQGRQGTLIQSSLRKCMRNADKAATCHLYLQLIQMTKVSKCQPVKLTYLLRFAHQYHLQVVPTMGRTNREGAVCELLFVAQTQNYSLNS